jgi:hypothetical protein
MRPGLFRPCQRTVSRQAFWEFARHRLRNLIGSCGRYGSIVSAKHYPGFGLPAVSFAAKRVFKSMVSGTRALDPVVLSGVIAELFPRGQALGIRSARPTQNRGAQPESQRRIVRVHKLENGLGC